MALKISSTNVVNDDRSFSLGSATPASPVTGQIRYTTDGFQVYNGVTWVAIANISPAPSPAWAWGSNQYGRLGDNSNVSRSSPVSVVGGFTDWAQVRGDAQFALAIRANGTAWAWGRNNAGQLGINMGSGVSRTSPASVVGGFTDWVQVAPGVAHSVALRAGGSAWAWGSNYRGATGTGSASSSPLVVQGGFTDWVQVAAGNSQSAAVRANGTAWGWGNNDSGQLGDNTTVNRTSPVSVVGGFTDWVEISTGGDISGITAAIRANGTAWCWGFGANGELGNSTRTSMSSPVSVVGGFTDWVQVAAGSSHVVALRAGGTAWGWGNGFYGNLGLNLTFPSQVSSPRSVVGGFTDWVQITPGNKHTAAVRAQGTAWAWGYNAQGQLGDNSNVSRSSPVSVVGGFTDWVQVSGGQNCTFALRAV